MSLFCHFRILFPEFHCQNHGNDLFRSRCRQFLLPEKLEEPYLTYNELQDSQGFDLSACCGKQVARYTYTVTNYPGRPEGVQANLYVCEGQPVAGDILCAGADGFQDTLVYPEQD